jgi:FtsH-binding integral membrane protein
MPESDPLKSVFARTEAVGPTISDTRYNLLIGAVILWGLAINWLLVRHVDTEALRLIPSWLFILGYVICAFTGVWLFVTHHRPAVSFLGYNLVVVPLGLVVTLKVARYDPSVVLGAIQITLLVTCVMTTLGALFPETFERLGSALLVSLSAVAITGAFSVLVTGARTIWADWAAALVFCGTVAYDWARAQRIPKTVDNAIDSAAAIYIDVIGLFLRVLRIMGRRDQKE